MAKRTIFTRTMGGPDDGRWRMRCIDDVTNEQFDDVLPHAHVAAMDAAEAALLSATDADVGVQMQRRVYSERQRKLEAEDAMRNEAEAAQIAAEERRSPRRPESPQ